MAFLLNEFSNLIAALEDGDVKYAVCGGLAMAIHGYPRATMDIDLLIRSESLDDVLKIGRENGYDIRGLDISFKDPVVEIRRVSKLIDGNLLCLDLLMVTSNVQDVWEAREEIDFQGRRLSVISRDGLIKMKKLAGRPQDLADIHRLENEEA